MQIGTPLIGIDGSLTAREDLVELETQNQRAYDKVNNVCALAQFNVTERERSSDGTWSRFPRSLSLAAEGGTKEDANKGPRLEGLEVE